MSRKKKAHDEAPKKPEPTFKNTGLAQALGQWKASKPVEQKPESSKKPAPPKPPKSKPSRLEDDDALFLRVMSDIERLPDAEVAEAPQQQAVRQEDLRDDAEALARLAELVAASEGFEFVSASEGVARGVDAGLLTPIRRGQFPIEARLELPGLSRETLERFLIDSRRQGLRCVSVRLGDAVTGLRDWMSRGRLSRMVLAFATVDGATAFVLRR